MEKARLEGAEASLISSGEAWLKDDSVVGVASRPTSEERLFPVYVCLQRDHLAGGGLGL